MDEEANGKDPLIVSWIRPFLFARGHDSVLEIVKNGVIPNRVLTALIYSGDEETLHPTA